MYTKYLEILATSYFLFLQIQSGSATPPYTHRGPWMPYHHQKEDSNYLNSATTASHAQVNENYYYHSQPLSQDLSMGGVERQEHGEGHSPEPGIPREPHAATEHNEEVKEEMKEEEKEPEESEGESNEKEEELEFAPLFKFNGSFENIKRLFHLEKKELIKVLLFVAPFVWTLVTPPLYFFAVALLLIPIPQITRFVQVNE